MRVAITGASGHLGANLVRALLNQGRHPRALVKTHLKALNGLDVETLKCDICDPDSLYRAFSGIDVVYHLAAQISLSMNDWPAVEAVNVIGTRNVVSACLNCGVRRLIHFSSVHALVQEPDDTPVNELRPLVDSQSCPPYDLSKAAGEREVRQGIEQGLDAVILNPTAIVGPHDYELSHFGAALLAMAQGKLPALIEGGFNWVDARDVAQGALQAEKYAPIGAKYLLSGAWASLRDLAKMTEEITGTPAPRLVFPVWLARTGIPMISALNELTGNRQLLTSVSIKALSNCNHRISHERATRELSYHPRPLRETLIDTFRWFQKNGMLDPTMLLKTSGK